MYFENETRKPEKLEIKPAKDLKNAENNRVIVGIGTAFMILGIAGPGWCQTLTEGWAEVFEKHNALGIFVLTNTSSEEPFIHNKKRSNENFIPAPTFKMLNSMIALQEASIKSADDTLKWDEVERGNRFWNQDSTSRSAFPVSCI